MHLNIETICPNSLKIWLPHLDEPIAAKKLAKEYPEFAALFDGKSTENTLFFYYKLNTQEQCLDFIDEDAEEEVAELLGVAITEFELADEEAFAGELESKELTDEDVAAFREHINDIRNGLDAIRNKEVSIENQSALCSPPGPQ
jgi:hypothetical protein